MNYPTRYRSASASVARPIITMLLYSLLAAILCTAIPARAHAKSPVKKIAILDFALADTSMEGQMEGQNRADQRRLALVERQVRRTLAESGRYVVMNTRPQRALIEKLRYQQDFFDCHGCELNVGKALGADLVLVGWVQKVSNLVLYLNIVVRDVHTGRLVRSGSIELKGNSDAVWSNGAAYVLKHDILAKPPAPVTRGRDYRPLKLGLVPVRNAC
jgi:Protein of unknown function (DUF2380)